MHHILNQDAHFWRIYPANIRLDEDVLKTFWRRLLSWSSEDALKTSLRRLDQDEFVRLSLTSSEDVFKTPWSRPIYSSWPYVFKTSSRRLAKTSSKHLQDVFKTSSKRLAKMFSKVFSRCIIKVNCLPRSRIFLVYPSEKFIVSVENLQVWYKFLKF